MIMRGFGIHSVATGDFLLFFTMFFLLLHPVERLGGKSLGMARQDKSALVSQMSDLA